jgi:WD40 repeat protein/tetratricopeptide (TPR) repeat protein
MSDSHRPNDVAVHNERSLKKLAWAIEASVGQFKLFLARCNYTSLRSRLVERLQELTTVEIPILELKASEKTLYARIQAELDSEQPDALMVFGLESVGDLDELLSATNQVREEFRKNFHFPVVLWVNDEVLKKLLQLAPDFESWATTTHFQLTTNELVDFLKETAERFFEGTLTLTLEACREIKLACQDIQTREQVLNIELTASIESLLGFTTYSNSINRNIDKALEHYQKGLELWQQSNNLELQGQILGDITFCYYLKALRSQSIEHQTWQTTRHYLNQCIEVFEKAQRPDLIANSMLTFGIILRRLQDWEQLQTLAQKALQLHQLESKSIEIAQDYGFLAEVALADKRWKEAREFAQRAIKVSSTVPSLQSPIISGFASKLPNNQSIISYAPVYYRFLLARAQQHLNQAQEAIRNLEIAREVGSPEFDTRFYLDILSHLQRLYFEHREYFKAFEIKLERQSIEQQYGFRAFVGAGWIEPKRLAKVALMQVTTQQAVAPEIVASGRLLDVDELIRRIGRNDYKLIVIHGQSGAGKSSLVNGGLMPALKQKVIGTQDVLPVSIRVYTNWVVELGRLLEEAFLEKGIKLTTRLDSEAAILEQVQQSEVRNLRAVLIFDQFEEFFFIYHEPAQRRRFFEFLGGCLSILSVKVVLSLREDYLHYLLECNRLPNMKIINNDILSKNILYPLGNFSPTNAHSIIEQLTTHSSFYLEPALIDQLVQDLAGELGEVRPIELQIVGAQLQTENITTLEQYRQLGAKAKAELVGRYLAEVVKDCGAENTQVAELVLYLLTDDKGTRPLKTKADLAANLAAEADKLDLVLKVFVKSGLVLLLPETPAERYQIVHDYLVAFIRQQQDSELLAKLKEAQDQRKHSEQRLNRFFKVAFLSAVVASIILTISTVLAVRFARQAQGLLQGQITALIQSSKTLANSDQAFDALLAGMRAEQPLREKQLIIKPEIRSRIVAALQQAVYEVRERNRLEGHTGSIISVSFSPDAKTIATASLDNTVKLWNIHGKELKTLRRHSGGVKSVSFSPDGKTIATASWDNTVKLWSRDGKELQSFKAHADRLHSISFSPDGQKIATASADKTAKLWSINGKELQTLKGHSGGVNSVSFSPDSKTIVTASDDNTAKLWSFDGKELKTLKGHSARVNSVSFSPDGKTIATASADNMAKLWSLDGKELKTLEEHTDEVWSISFSPDGQTIATASADKTAKLWRRDGKAIKTLTGHKNSVYSVRFSPDGKTIATASKDTTTKLWSSDVSPALKLLKGHNHRVWDVSFSPDSQIIATASEDNTVMLWSREGKTLQTINGHSARVNSVSFSPDSKTIATASFDETAKLWSLKGKELKTLKGHSARVNRVSFSRDGKTIATASADNTVKLWSSDGKLLQTLKGHKDWVWDVSFSPDGNRIATASLDNTAKLWSLKGKELKTLNGHTDQVYSVSFSPDGQMIATTSRDNTAKLWSLDGTAHSTLRGHSDAIWSMSFSPDGKTIATASGDNTTKLWKLDGKELLSLKGHTDQVYNVSFSPDGKTIVTASADNTAILWNLNLDLDALKVIACDWIRDYLKYNLNVENKDRYLCDVE